MLELQLFSPLLLHPPGPVDGVDGDLLPAVPGHGGVDGDLLPAVLGHGGDGVAPLPGVLAHGLGPLPLVSVLPGSLPHLHWLSYHWQLILLPALPGGLSGWHPQLVLSLPQLIMG